MKLNKTPLWGRHMPVLLPVHGQMNFDEGLFDTSEITSHVDPQLIKEESLIAQEIILRATLKALPVSNPKVTVCRITEGETLKLAQLYAKTTPLMSKVLKPEECCWAGAALVYTGQGVIMQEGKKQSFQGTALPHARLILAAQDRIYKKDFLNVTQPLTERITTFHGGQVLISPPGVQNCSVLRPYGGMVRTGCSLEDVRQTFFMITESHGKTRIQLKKTLPQHKVVFHPTPSKQSLQSLAHDISAGRVTIQVETELGTSSFSSFAYQKYKSHSNHFTLHFHPQP